MLPWTAYRGSRRWRRGVAQAARPRQHRQLLRLRIHQQELSLGLRPQVSQALQSKPGAAVAAECQVHPDSIALPAGVAARTRRRFLASLPVRDIRLSSGLEALDLVIPFPARTLAATQLLIQQP